MAGYLFRRILQMILVIFLSAVASYTLLSLAPGGPLSGLRQQQQTSRFRITEEDIARIRATFEMDLFLPVRFSRWFIGLPTGPLTIGNYEFFANYTVGCRKPIEETRLDAKGNFITVETGCKELVYLKDLKDRKTSRGVLFGDFGESWQITRGLPVSDLLLTRLPYTIQLAGLSFLLSLIIAIPLGIYSAVKQYSRFDYVFTLLAFIGSSMPTFFFGILMILFFSVLPNIAGSTAMPAGSAEAVRDYTIQGVGDVTAGSLVDKLLHLVLPVLTLTIVSVSGYSRFIRASMLEVLRQDYVRTARAKGLMERFVIVKHALRNALIPFVTIVVFEIPALFGGAIITESIFSWPGMGRLYISALGNNDYPVAMAFFFILAVLTLIATLLRDIAYTIVDPRIRFS
jgi:peptide/nickel transport system permease protein